MTGWLLFTILVSSCPGWRFQRYTSDVKIDPPLPWLTTAIAQTLVGFPFLLAPWHLTGAALAMKTMSLGGRWAQKDSQRRR